MAIKINKDIQIGDTGKTLEDVVLKSTITLALYSNATMSSTLQKINLQNYKSTGNKFSTYNDGVKIGAGINYVLVSAVMSAVWNSPISNDFCIYIYKNNSQLLRVNGQKPDSTISNSVVLTPTLIEVQENDVIYMYYFGSANNSILYGSSLLGTQMTIQEI